MRILFDKNVPYQLCRHLDGNAVRTAAEQGWSRLANGDLLKKAEANGFEVMISADQNLEYQQNLKGGDLALIVLSTNHIGVMEKQAARLVAAVEAASVGSYQFVKFDLTPKARSKPGA